MNQKPHQRRGLGRGLGALIPTGPRIEDEAGDGAGTVLTASTSGPDWIGVPLPGDEPHADPAVPEGSQGTSTAIGEAAPEDRAAQEDGPAHPSEHRGAGPAQRDGEIFADEGRASGEAALGASVSAPTTTVGEPAAAQREVPQVEVTHVQVPHWEVAHPGIGQPEAVEPEMAEGPELRSVDGAWFAELPVDAMGPNPRQPREVFDEEAMAELVASIREVGLLQPVVVRPVADGRYELVMGERRWRATRQAGLTTIPAIVRRTTDDDLLRDALLENLHRSQLNALEEAAAYQQLLEDFGCTHEELATRIGRSRPQISNTIRLLKLSPAVQRRVAAGVLSAGHARTLLGVEDAGAQDRLAARVVSEGISVRGLEELVTVGDLGGRPTPTRRKRPTAPGVEDLAARLSNRLETRVKVDLGQRKGRITVEFASLPDLERIVAVIDPEHPHRTRQD